MATQPIRVLVVDDSSMVRSTLLRELSKEQDIQVIDTAPDPFVAREKLLLLKPDVMTLDIEMPRMDGISFLKRVMEHCPLPVIVLSSIAVEGSATALAAHEAGAFDVIAKPTTAYSVGEAMQSLIERIRAAAASKAVPKSLTSSSIIAAKSGSHPFDYRKIVALGASTGGVQALTRVLMGFPADAPGIVIVQHMPPGFTKSFADRLSTQCKITVREAKDGDRVEPGLALLAPGGVHMALAKDARGYKAELRDGPKVFHQKPAVDVLFRSVATTVTTPAIGALLTGMGRDGAAGLLEMKNSGCHTIAQNEATCAVYGMPKAAVDLGAAHEILPLDDIAQAICHAASTPRALRAG